MFKKSLLVFLFFFILSVSLLGLNKIKEPNYAKTYTNTSNSTTTLSKKVSIPIVDFSFNNDGSCSGTAITFTPTVTGITPFKYLWDFGDGTTSTDSNPTHAFNELGCGFQNNNVRLTVTDNVGATNSVTKIISIQEKPDLEFANLNAPAGSMAPFEKCGDNNINPEYTINVGDNSNSAGCITSYNVDWGDETSETNVTFPSTHTYTSLGSYNMVITGIGGSGCNNSITYVVKNSNNPIGALVAPGNTTNLCTPVSPMEFAISSWALNPSDTNYQVNYGDGTIVNYTQAQLESSLYYNASNPPASQDFPIPHTFTTFNCPSGNIVKLRISTSCGSTFFEVKPIIILDAPITNFSVNSIVCANTSTYFNNNTIAGYTNNCSTVDVYTWDFGDGSPQSRAVNPSHVYTTPGTYTVTLNSETPCGIGSEVTKTICVEPILQPNFSFGNACNDSPLVLTNTTDTSLSCGTETYTWDVISSSEAYCGEDPLRWNFANGTNRNSKDPQILFRTPGIYNLRLTTRNSCGINRSITKTVHVKKKPEIELNPISDFCQSATINPVGKVLKTCSPNSEISYAWSFPGGTPSTSTSLNPGSIDYTTSGNYTATFSVTNSCGTTSLSRNFTVDLVLSPIIQPKTLEICSGNSFTVRPTNGTDNVPSGTTYTWGAPIISPAGAISGAFGQSSPRTSISQTLTNTTSGTATATYTVSPIADSCPGPDFTVTVTVYPTINVTPDISRSTCFEADDGSINITITGGIPFTSGNPYTISWTGPNGFTSSNADISNLEDGSYSLNIISDDGGFCPFNATYFVGEPGEFKILGQGHVDISCFDKNDGRINISVTGGNPPYTYVWTKDENPFAFTGEAPRNLESGDYEVTVTEANNCGILTSNTFTIINPPLLEITLESDPIDTILCYGDFTGVIEVSAMGGKPFGGTNYRWSWTGPNGFRSSNQNLSSRESGTYNLTVTDNSGCTENLQVFIAQNPQINLDLTIKPLTCYNDDSGAITVNNISGGIPPYEPLVWSNLGTGMFQDNLSAGIYTITVTDAIGCTRVFPIPVDNAPIFDIDPDINHVSCFGESDGSIKLNLVGGESSVTITWSDGAAAGNERNNIGPGKYDVTIIDNKGCILQDTFTIREPQLLTLIGIATDALDCDDVNSGSIDLEITGGTRPLSIVWNNGARTEDLPNIPPDLYTVTITDANQCKISDTFEVKRFNPLLAPFEVITNFDCITREVDQTFITKVEGGVPPYSLSWSNENSVFVSISGINNEIMNTNENGLVILTVTDGLGCVKDFSIQVEKPVLDDARFSTSSFGKSTYGIYSIKDPILFTNEALGSIENISWDFGDGNFSSEENPNHSYINPGTYTITQTVTYPFGCEYSKDITLVIEKGYSLIMPNAFTPNNDALNNTFAPVFIGLSAMKLDIYDTWGNIIYSELADEIEGWDGKIKSDNTENGNYYYKFSAKTFYGDTITKEGVLTLIK